MRRNHDALHQLRVNEHDPKASLAHHLIEQFDLRLLLGDDIGPEVFVVQTSFESANVELTNFSLLTDYVLLSTPKL